MAFSWIIDTLMEDRNDHLRNTTLMVDAVNQLGLNPIRARYIPFSEDTDLVLDDPVMPAIYYGCIGLGRQIRRKYPGLKPGGFWESSKFSVGSCSVAYGGHMLNASTRLDEPDSFTLSQMAERLPDLVARYGPLFVRPDGGNKAFTGSVVGGNYSVENFLRYVGSITEGDSHVDPHAAVIVRKPAMIQGEYRFVCSRGEIITGSQYRWDNRLDIRSDVHPMAQVYAERIVNEFEGPDLVYVMDIAICEDHYGKIVEFNNFSNSGLYACDRLKVVKRVTEICQSIQ